MAVLRVTLRAVPPICLVTVFFKHLPAALHFAGDLHDAHGFMIE